MAAPDELTTLLGVLVPGDGRLRFCRADSADFQTGEWIEVDGEPARIVFGPGQVEYPDAPVDLPRVRRRLTPDEIASLRPLVRSAASQAVRFGGLGRLQPRITDLDAYIRQRLRLDSPGDEPVSPDLPQLGTIVETDSGPGVLLGISMRHRRATVRLASGEEVEVELEALTPGPSPSIGRGGS